MFLVDGHFKHLGSSATITKLFYALTFGAFYYAMYSLLACFAYRCWILADPEGIFGFKISLTRLVQILVGYGMTIKMSNSFFDSDIHHISCCVIEISIKFSMKSDNTDRSGNIG
jgi:hypothetical protein